ncbi:hypothetical protein DFQ13_101308 [Actinokineospora spheciospongiae]|nr:hypothetical protein DFQ13_101308 [Actinokineospora spheciospongiae]
MTGGPGPPPLGVVTDPAATGGDEVAIAAPATH